MLVLPSTFRGHAAIQCAAIRPPPVAAQLTERRASFAGIPSILTNGWRNLITTLGKSEAEMTRLLDMSLLDELQREGFFEPVSK